MKRHQALLLWAAALALSSAASAGPIEDAFRGYLDQLKQRGQQLPPAWQPGGRVPMVTKPALAKRTDQLPLGRSQYAVFVTRGCPRCDQAVQALRAQGVAFDVLDLSSSATAREAWPLVKAQGVPAVLVGGYVMSGWDPEMFKQAFTAEAQDQHRARQGDGA